MQKLRCKFTTKHYYAVKRVTNDRNAVAGTSWLISVQCSLLVIYECWWQLEPLRMLVKFYLKCRDVQEPRAKQSRPWIGSRLVFLDHTHKNRSNDVTVQYEHELHIQAYVNSTAPTTVLQGFRRQYHLPTTRVVRLRSLVRRSRSNYVARLSTTSWTSFYPAVSSPSSPSSPSFCLLPPANESASVSITLVGRSFFYCNAQILCFSCYFQWLRQDLVWGTKLGYVGHKMKWN